MLHVASCLTNLCFSSMSKGTTDVSSYLVSQIFKSRIVELNVRFCSPKSFNFFFVSLRSSCSPSNQALDIYTVTACSAKFATAVNPRLERNHADFVCVMNNTIGIVGHLVHLITNAIHSLCIRRTSSSGSFISKSTGLNGGFCSSTPCGSLCSGSFKTSS